MKRIVYLVILMLVIFWLAIFVAVNLQTVPIYYWFFNKTWGEVPLIAVILCSILLGALIAALVGGISEVKLLSQNRRQRKMIKNLEHEIATLKSIPVKEVEKEVRETEEPEKEE